MIRRVLLALAGSTFGALIVAWLEASVAREEAGGTHLPPAWRLAEIDLGLVAPLAALVGLVVGLLSLGLEPEAARAPWTYGQMAPTATPEARGRAAALAGLGVSAVSVWTFLVAHLATSALAEGSPSESGVRLAALAAVLLALLVAAAVALLPPLSRALSRLAVTSPRLVHPWVLALVTLLLATSLLSWGIAGGDPSGDSDGLFIFGVLRRRELDLRPVADLLAIAFFAYVATWFFGRARAGIVVPIAAAVAALTLLVTAYDAHAMDGQMETGLTLERHAPLGKRALAILRKATDRDHDGAARMFGGGDCNDRDPDISPAALDVPGNGIDEDCSGSDEPSPADRGHAIPGEDAGARADGGAGIALTTASEAGAATYDGKEQNLLLITVDTLRNDCGFMGYPKPTTPNLDKLAEHGVVFDDAHSLASYTGKALGPLLIGKYPSETLRDGGHFNTYFPGNVFLAERAKAAGMETLGAASHWYFSSWTGLLQGIDVWDLSARPPSGQGDTDGNITGDKLSDAALKLLARPELEHQRFFMWLHYFDPHAQYMAHAGSPDFLGDETGGLAKARAAYDGEVWFTDKQIGRVLDALSATSFGAKTVIMVTADHGEAFADHGMSMHGGELWESLVRVPLLIAAPGLPPHHVPVKRSDIDLVPTAIDLLSLAPAGPRELSGVSLLPDLLSKDGPYEERDVYIDMPPGPYTGLRRALIHGPTPGTKLISFGTTAYELFDLSKDPDEKEDLTSDRDLFNDMLARLKAQRASMKEIDVKPDEPKGAAPP